MSELIEPSQSKPEKTNPWHAPSVRLDKRAQEPPPASPAAALSAAPQKPAKKKYWGMIFTFGAFTLVFWLIEFFYQYKVLIPGELSAALIRSFSLAGTTLIAASLFSSALFKWFPRTARHWRVRRYLGVSGFALVLLHVATVYYFLFDFNIKASYYTLNPAENPIIFGALSFYIFLMVALTSSDWMVGKIGSRRWKFIHRFVYLAFVAAIFHFITINPPVLMNTAGYLLFIVSVLALIGQLFWYFKIASKRGFRAVGTWVGILLMAATLLMGYVVYRQRYYAPPTEAELTAAAAAEMMRYIQQHPEGDADVAKVPVTADQSFIGLTVIEGVFQNLNYMSSGSVSLEKKGSRFYVMFHEDFSTPDGPDLQVYLTKNSAPTTRSDILEGLALGKLKSIAGKQVYAIPAEVNVNEYHSVTIHCRAFNVPWSYVFMK